MKKLLLIFLVLVSFASYGQRIQKANTYGLAFNRTGADTLFYLPNDTFTVPSAYLTYPFMARKGANVYIWNTSSNVWQGLTGGTLDTTGAFVTSVYRRSDSVFYVKGGVHTFAFKDSTGASTPTLQQVLTAGSTLTTDNTIDFGGNDFILKGDSIVIKEASGVSKIRFVPGSQSGGRSARIYLTNSDEWGDGYITAGDEYLETNAGWYVRNTIGGNAALSINGSSLSGSDPQIAPLIEAIQNGVTLFQVANDSIFFRPFLGRFLIDTLTSAVGTKALRYNPTTGLVSYADTTTGGGGITIGTTAITSGTVGRILFEGSGNVVQQSSNLFWNNTDGELDVFGGGNEEGLNLVSTNANYGTHLVFKYNTSTSAAFLKPLYNGGLAIGTDGSGDYINIGGILGVDGKLKVQGYVYESGGYAAVINTNHATTVGLNVALKVSQTADAINVSSSGGTKLFGVDSSGKILQNTTITAGGTTGNQTIDKPTGTVNIAAAGTTVTVTNNKCTANSIVYAVLRTNDATATGIKSVVPSAGSFVITLNAAATAEVSVGFIVFN